MSAQGHSQVTVVATTSEPSPRNTRLQRALEEAMKVHEGPELLCKITSREWRDAFQAIAIQQRGFTPYDTVAIPVMFMDDDPAHPGDKSKQCYHCRIGADVLTPDTAKALQTSAAARGVGFTASPKNEFSQSHWFKAIVISLHAADLKQLIDLVNDELIVKVRPDASVTYDDVIRVAQDELGKLFS